MTDLKTLLTDAVNKLVSKKTDSDVTETSTNPVSSSGVKSYVDTSIETNLIAFKESLASVATQGTFESLTETPTTLSGYGITDAKISNGTITLGKNSITPATSLAWSNITSKPTTVDGYGITDAVKSDSLATVATSGSYNDLTDKPLNTSTSIEVENFTVTDASVIPTFSMTDVVAVVVFVNNVLAKDGESYGITGGTTLTFSQTMPVGTEITIYKFVSVGSVIPTPSYSIDSSLSDTSTNAVQNKVVKAAIESKADEATVNALISETVTPLQTSIDTAYAKYVAELG